MLKTLIKKQFLELYQTYYVDKKTGKARKKSGTVLYFILLAFLFLCLGLAFFAMSMGLGTAMLNNGQNWVYFAMMGLVSMALGLFGSIFSTYASVYLPKDNELLLPMPIPDRTLLLARLSVVLITSLMYSAWVWIPAAAAYWVLVPVTFCGVLFPILLTFVIAVFVSVLSCILGWVVALVASRTKGKSFLTLFMSLFVMIAYYVVYFKVLGSMEDIALHMDAFGATVKNRLHFTYLLGTAADGSVSSMLLVTAIALALAVICVRVLAKSFRRLALSEAKTEKKQVKADAYRQQSIKKVLLKKELTHFKSVPVWMLNGGFGLLLLVVGGTAALIKSGDIRGFLDAFADIGPELFAILPPLLVAADCLILSTNTISPVSVSFEGKSLWILQSLPVETSEILRAKERMGVQLSLYPGLFFALAVGIVFRFSAAELALVCLAVYLYTVLLADFGLFLNLKKPNMSWTNAASLTKQSLPVVINLFGGWVFCAVFGIAGYIIASAAGAAVALLCLCALFALLLLVMRRWLNKKGTKILASL